LQHTDACLAVVSCRPCCPAGSAAAAAASCGRPRRKSGAGHTHAHCCCRGRGTHCCCACWRVVLPSCRLAVMACLHGAGLSVAVQQPAARMHRCTAVRVLCALQPDDVLPPPSVARTQAGAHHVA
jgi:hypothetical protein